MDCRATAAHKFRTRLRFKQLCLNSTKKQSVLKTCRHNISFLGYKIDLYFHNYEFAKEIEKNDLSGSYIGYAIRDKKNNRNRIWL